VAAFDKFGRVLFVHAHPDDESIATGGTIALLIDRGVAVTVVTCTRGELGEIIPDALRRSIRTPEKLGAHREGELAQALAVLGVTDHRFLGGAGARAPGRAPRRYLDSGMRWSEHGAEALDQPHRDSLVAAPLNEAVVDLVAAIADVQADAVISYDTDGGYGHPDHVRASAVSRLAARAAGIPFFAIDPLGELVIDVSAVLDRKRAALAAHQTQLIVIGDEIELSNGARRPIATTESYRPPGKIDSETALKGSSIQ
jgi:N-acetyl-1-D-myo-inositol-2-amino-2-deoxy-alpha-D-glucopyranoside deacetylase